MTSAPRYTTTEALYHDEGVTLCRAVRVADRRPVILRVLDTNRRPRDLARLQHELALAAALDPHAVLRPLALDETAAGAPALVLEDFGGRPLEADLTGPLPVEPFLELAVRIAGAVAVIHEQGLVHKDLKPGNILVHAVTREVKITGFGLATRLPREQQAARPPELIEGSLPYLSPEQTGRVSRAIDRRSDLYAVGVTFYEMLTGRLPFEARDPLEWIHAHVARVPPSPSRLVPAVPETIARIVLRLLAKMAEDRYQSARGLQLDLERCLAQWRSLGRIDGFPLGTRDAADHLQIPQRLYGRAAEIATLVEALARVATTGRPELVLASGEAGIGKSALIHALDQPVVERRGYLVAGKFDALKPAGPYATIIVAFKELVDQILAEGDAAIRVWRQRLHAALGVNGQLIVDLIPQLELVVGPQLAVTELPIAPAHHRFRMALRQFIAGFARPDHPVVLFLDDLQWADAASLGALKELVTHPEVHGLLLVGAYRAGEVGDAHPLRATLGEARREGARITAIALGPLAPAHLMAFVGDALRCRPDDAAPLCDLIREKTAANPFFVIQFLSALCEQRLIELDGGTGAWRWDLAKVRAQGFTDNVVDLMIAKVSKLPAATLEALEQIACLGHRAELAAVATVLGRADADREAVLWEAQNEGLLGRVGDTYEFAHDRVQEAVYSLIPEPSRPAVHLRIGRQLLAQTPAGTRDEGIFDLVAQLQRGVSLIVDPDERAAVAQLQCRAGRKARAAGACAAAGAYFAGGLALLPAESWSARHELAYDLHVGRAECAAFAGDHDEAETLCQRVLQHARTNAERARVYRLQIDLATTRGEYAAALAIGIECLRLLGLELPADPPAAQVRAEERRVWQLLGHRPIEDLIDLPPMTNPDMRAALEVLAAMHPPAHFARESLFQLIPATMTTLSLRHGNAPASAIAYVTFGVRLTHARGRLREGYRWGRLACELLERNPAAAQRAQVYLLMGGCISLYSQPLASALTYLDRCYAAAHDAGDLPFACYARLQAVAVRFMQGAALDEVDREAEQCAVLARHGKFELIADAVASLQRTVRALRGHTASLRSFDGPGFSEAAFEAHVRGGVAHSLCWYQIHKLQLLFFAGDYAAARRAADELQERDNTFFGEPVVPDYCFYSALTLAALPPAAASGPRPARARLLDERLQQLRRWADHCPETFRHRHDLVAAEVARLEHRDSDATRLYEQAIRSAREHGFVQHEGLAAELAANFHLARGRDAIAETHRRAARAGYARWGAAAKVRQLEDAYPRLPTAPARAPAPTFAAPAAQLDVLAVLAASQTLSGEIVIEQLVATLLRVLLQHSGAQRSCLILAHDGELAIEAEAAVADDGVTTAILPSLPLGSTRVPVSLIRVAERTREPVILDDAGVGPERFAADAYFARHRPRSVVCVPILGRAQLVGLLYLENDLVAGAFTAGRLTALTLLASQAAISLQNARLLAQEQAARAAAEQAEARAAFLAGAGVILSESLDYEATIARLTRLCVGALCDWCVIDVVDGPRVRRLAGAHADPSRAPQLRRLQERYPPRRDSPQPAAQVLRSGEARLWPAVDDDLLRTLCEDDEHLELIRALGTASGMVVPLVARGATLGVLTLGAATPGRYGPADLALAQELARRAALAIDNARLHRETERAVHLRDEFLSVASHELRTPLTSLMLTLQNLARAPGTALTPALTATLAATAERQGQRLTRLVGQLLEVSRIEQGQLPLEPQEVDLAALTRDVLAGFERDLARAGCRASLEAPHPVVGRWDASRLEQVIANLLGNAIKFGAGAPIEVAVGATPAAARLTVQDHGIGIAPAEQPRIFDRFARAVSAQRYGGLGLGLFVCRSIVAAHGGRITVASAPGEGATFTVLLPCAGPPERGVI